MKVIKATTAHLNAILEIYRAARSYMAASGNPHQWGGAYPPVSLVEDDICRQCLYLCVEGEELLGVFFYSEEEEPTYRVIDGAWLNDRPSGVMHRVAVARHGCGVAGFCFDFCLERCRNLKIDTHRDNLPMQRALEKNGFVRCGKIRLENGEERLAYQKSKDFY